MKQLKFMLAAATAIGIATVVQADVFNGSTDFESSPLVSVDGIFPSLPDGADETVQKEFARWEVPTDNFSTLVDSTDFGGKTSPKQYKDHTKALNVDVGEGTLVRHIENDGNNATVKDGTVYIDTMVQFTVTPDEAAPTPGEEDKLMLYAKEADGEIKLHVATARVTSDFSGSVTLTPKVIITDKILSTNGEWYRLTIKSDAKGLNNGKSVDFFEIYIDGERVSAKEVLLLNEDSQYMFPSIQGATETAGIKAVGFSGEGKVDDLVFTTEYPFEASTVDFTLTMFGGSPVSVTIGDVNYNFENNVVEIPAATTEFTVNYNSDYFASTLAWSNCSGCTANDATVTLNTGVTGASATLTLENNANATPPTVNDSTSAASVGINSGAFKDATGGELSKLLSWAIAKGVSKNVVNEIPPFEDETGNATNDVQAAYLLNCEVAEVATKKGEFKFTPNDFYKLMGSGLGATNLEIDKEDYNGEFVLEGATTLKDEISGKPDWSTAAEAPKFFRARLTK